MCNDLHSISIPNKYQVTDLIIGLVKHRTLNGDISDLMFQFFIHGFLIHINSHKQCEKSQNNLLSLEL